MSTLRILAIVLAIAAPGCAPNPVAQSPDLGRVATQDEIRAWDLSVLPDGAGLPPGGGTAATGATVYELRCQRCHGAKGAGRPNDQLVGGQGSLATKTPVRTIGSYWPYATTVFDYVRRAMPYDAPKSLTDNEVYAVTAYLLSLNGIISAGEEMNARTLPSVAMPNRDGFVLMYPLKPR